MKIYHNPRCRKSRETLQIINEKNIEVEIIEYLKDSPTKTELVDLIETLGIKAEDLIRKNESIFKENYKGKDLSESDWIQAMLDHPKLMERPIVVQGNQAIIGRPPTNVLDLIK